MPASQGARRTCVQAECACGGSPLIVKHWCAVQQSRKKGRLHPAKAKCALREGHLCPGAAIQGLLSRCPQPHVFLESIQRSIKLDTCEQPRCTAPAQTCCGAHGLRMSLFAAAGSSCQPVPFRVGTCPRHATCVRGLNVGQLIGLAWW